MRRLFFSINRPACVKGKIGSFMKTWLAILLTGLRLASAADFAWMDSSRFRPPDFEGTFPADAEGARRLEAALPELERRGRGDETDFELLRLGLRELRVDRQMPALRWFGNAYVWGKSPQDPRAIELMYHASGSTNSAISYHAIYFGLSTVRPMTEPILRALVEAGMRSEDPNVLSRIAWGAAAQKEGLLKHLQPHRESGDSEKRRRAEVLAKIFSGEMEAFAWAEERARESAKEKFGGRLEEFRKALAEGALTKRREVVDLIQRERIALIMDDSFVGAFAAGAEGGDVKTREEIAIIVGSRWVWVRGEQNPEAIKLMTRLSRDVDRAVRYNAMYYGLSTVRNRDDTVVDRMIEMLMEDGIDDRNFRRRITWGFRDEKELVRRSLEKWIGGEDLVRALFAYGFYLDFLGEKPAPHDAVDELLDKPSKIVAALVAFGPTEGSRVSDADDFLSALRAEVGKDIRWANRDGPPFVMVKNEAAAAIRTRLLTSPRVKIFSEHPLSVEALVTIGKEGGLKSLK